MTMAKTPSLNASIRPTRMPSPPDSVTAPPLPAHQWHETSWRTGPLSRSLRRQGDESTGGDVDMSTRRLAVRSAHAATGDVDLAVGVARRVRRPARGAAADLRVAGAPRDRGPPAPGGWDGGGRAPRGRASPRGGP